MNKASFGKMVGLAAIITAFSFTSEEARAQKKIHLPLELQKVEVTQSEADYFIQRKNTPMILEEMVEIYTRTGQHERALDYIQKGLFVAAHEGDNYLYNYLIKLYGPVKEKAGQITKKEQTARTEVRKEERFAREMGFGVFKGEEGRLIVYNYIQAQLKGSSKDSSNIKYQARLTAKGQLYHLARRELRENKTKGVEGEKIELISYKDKTLFICSFEEYNSKRTTRKLTELLEPFHNEVPREQIK